MRKTWRPSAYPCPVFFAVAVTVCPEVVMVQLSVTSTSPAGPFRTVTDAREASSAGSRVSVRVRESALLESAT